MICIFEYDEFLANLFYKNKFFFGYRDEKLVYVINALDL